MGSLGIDLLVKYLIGTMLIAHMQNGHKKEIVVLNPNTKPCVVYLCHFRDTFVSVTISHPNFMALPVDMMALFANIGE